MISAKKLIRLAEAFSISKASTELKAVLEPDNVEKEDQDIRMDFDNFSIWLRADSRGDFEAVNGTLPKSKKTQYDKLVKKYNIESDVIFR